MGADTLEWSPAMLGSAKARIEVRRRANLDQLILAQGRHQGLIEALANLRVAHADATKATADEAGSTKVEGAGLAQACRQVHELAVATHAEVLTQAGSVRENEGLIEALGAMTQQADERRAARDEAAAAEAARAEADAQAAVEPEPEPEPASPVAEAVDERPIDTAPAAEPVPVAGPTPSLPAGHMTVGQAIAAEERRAALSSFSRKWLKAER